MAAVTVDVHVRLLLYLLGWNIKGDGSHVHLHNGVCARQDEKYAYTQNTQKKDLRMKIFMKIFLICVGVFITINCLFQTSLN